MKLTAFLFLSSIVILALVAGACAGEEDEAPRTGGAIRTCPCRSGSDLCTRDPAFCCRSAGGARSASSRTDGSPGSGSPGGHDD